MKGTITVKVAPERAAKPLPPEFREQFAREHGEYDESEEERWERLEREPHLMTHQDAVEHGCADPLPGQDPEFDAYEERRRQEYEDQG